MRALITSVLLLTNFAFAMICNDETGWCYSQSTLQSFYLFQYITVDDEGADPGESDVGPGDVIGAFKDGECVGWAYIIDTDVGTYCLENTNNCMTTLPLMGDDGTVFGLDNGDIPDQILIYDSTYNSYLDINISDTWADCANGNYELDDIPDYYGNYPDFSLNQLCFLYGTTTAYNSLGCTDETACNYNPNVETDDGSCVYNNQDFNCDDDGNMIDCFDELFIPVIDNQGFTQVAQSDTLEQGVECYQFTLFSDAYTFFSESDIEVDDYIYIEVDNESEECRVGNIVDVGTFSKLQVICDDEFIYDYSIDCANANYAPVISQTNITLMEISNFPDICDICNGDNSTCSDCAEIPNGPNTEDNCGVCNSDPTDDCVQDCNGEWGGSAVIDECGVCDGFGPEEGYDCEGNCLSNDCNGDCGGLALIDDCDICTGGNTEFEYNEFLDCSGTCFGSAIADECGVCEGSGPDIFGVCGGDNSIQGAIDAAESGSIITIPAGSYYESIELNKSIELHGGQNVIIYAGGNSIGITVSSSDVTIRDLSIIGGNNTFAGIVVEPGSDNISILNNSISDIFYQVPQNDSPHGYGILVYGDSDAEDPPTNVLIDGNTVLNILGVGISLGSLTESVTVSNNLVTNIAPAMIDGQELSAGVIAQLANNVMVIGNTFSTVEIGTSLIQSIGAISDNIYDDVSSFALISAFDGSPDVFDVPVSLDGYDYYNAVLTYTYQGIPVNINGYFSSLEALNLAGSLGDIVSATGYFTDGSTIDYTADCFDQWGGSADIDTCGVCGGDNSSCDVLGDTNGDGQLDILDIVILINMVLEDIYDPIADMNDDGICNILDIVILVDIVLYSDVE